MRLSVMAIATAALAILLTPASLLHAEEAATHSVDAKNEGSAASSSSAGSDSFAEWLTAPMPASSVAVARPYSRGLNNGTPRLEWFMGYSYLRAVPSLSAGNRLMWLNGGSTSVALNLNRVLGIVGDFGGYNETRLLLTTGNPPAAVGTYQAVDDGTVFTYLVGPRLSYRRYDRLTPFVQVLFGGIHASEETLCPTCAPLLPVENAFAMTAGGGLDIRIHRHFALRVIQAEYLMTRLQNLDTGSNASQNNVRLSAGIVLRFGGNAAPKMPPPSPLAYSCTVNPSSAFPGDTIAVSGTALNLDPAKTAVYTWSVDGGNVDGNGETAKIDTTNIAPGSYTLKGHVSDGDKPNANADCTAPYSVKAFEPPTVSCEASPSTVVSGATSTITATAVSPQSRPLTYSYSSASNAINGNGATATLSTGGASAGTISVTCTVVDDKNQTAQAATTVTVANPVAAEKPITSALCSIHFERDSHRPARVDNEGKACLDEIALNLQRSADTKLAIVGNASNREAGGKKLAGARAVNAKAYLVRDKGIDSTRVLVYTGSQQEKVASTTLIPAGATLDTAGDSPIN